MIKAITEKYFKVLYTTFDRWSTPEEEITFKGLGAALVSSWIIFFPQFAQKRLSFFSSDPQDIQYLFTIESTLNT